VGRAISFRDISRWPRRRRKARTGQLDRLTASVQSCSTHPSSCPCRAHVVALWTVENGAQPKHARNPLCFPCDPRAKLVASYQTATRRRRSRSCHLVRRENYTLTRQDIAQRPRRRQVAPAGRSFPVTPSCRAGSKVRRANTWYAARAPPGVGRARGSDGRPADRVRFLRSGCVAELLRPVPSTGPAGSRAPGGCLRPSARGGVAAGRWLPATPIF
jgi:hypothetical protein